MRSDRVAPWAAGLLTLGCEWVGGIEEYRLRNTSTQAEPQCVLPQQGDAAVRLGHFADSLGGIDLCWRPSGTASFSPDPVLQASGEACPKGIRYQEVTTKLALPGGTYDFRVTAGASCERDSVAELAQVTVAANETVTLLLVENATGRKLVALPEDAPDLAKTRVRFVNVVSGAAVLRAGITHAPRLPTVLDESLFGDVPFGAAAGAQAGQVRVDQRGYMEFPFLDFPLGAALVDGGVAEPDALVTLQSNQYASGTHTLYATGKLQDSLHPPKLMACEEQGEPDGILSRCGAPIEVQLDAFNPYLTDRFATLIGARAPAVVAALGALQSDLVCLMELNRADDVEQIVAATAPSFPYHASSRELMAEARESSALEDQQGVLPPIPTNPACAGEDAQLLEAFALSLERSPCVAKSPDGASYLAEDGDRALECITTECFQEFKPLLLGEASAQTCGMCAEVQLASYASTQTMRDRCANPNNPDPKARFAFDGEPGLLVLSRYPIEGASLRLLPSTSWQRAALRAPVLLPNGVPLDFYCTSLSEFPASHIPYTGPYGKGQTGEAAVVEEALLQVSRIVAFVNEQSTGGRPIIAGEFYAGPEYANANGVVLESVRPAVYASLLDSYRQLVAAEYTPACTVCPSNALLESPGLGSWTTHIVGSHTLATSVSRTTVAFTDPSSSNAQGEPAPISPHYGLRSVLRVAQ